MEVIMVGEVVNLPKDFHAQILKAATSWRDYLDDYLDMFCSLIDNPEAAGIYFHDDDSSVGVVYDKELGVVIIRGCESRFHKFYHKTNHLEIYTCYFNEPGDVEREMVLGVKLKNVKKIRVSKALQSKG